MRFRSTRGIFAVLLALALVAAACGGDDDGGGDSTADAPATEDGATAAEGDVDPEATLVFGDAWDAATLDPDLIAASFGLQAAFPAYDRLLHATPDGELAPGLATEWEYVDPTTLELTLREGVVFHDGEPFDADAVVANIERSRTLPEAVSLVQNAIAHITGVEAVDETTVRITLDSPDYQLPFNLTQNLGMMKSPAALEDDLTLTAVGAGPYRLVEFSPGDRVVYEPFEDYWDDEMVRVGRLELVAMPDAETRINAVRSGEADLVSIEPRQIADAEAAGLDVLTKQTVATFNIVFNFDHAPLDDARVRQALQLAVNRQSITDNLTFGTGAPTTQMFPPGYVAHAGDEYAPENYYDPEQAIQLLEEAGQTDLSLSMFVNNRPEDIRLAEVVQEMLQEIGVTLSLEVRDPSQFTLFAQDGEFDMFLNRWLGRLDPGLTLALVYGPEGALINPAGYTTDRMADLLSEIAATDIGDERVELIQQANVETVEQALNIPIFSSSAIFAFEEGCIQGFEPFVAGPSELRGVGKSSSCSS